MQIARVRKKQLQKEAPGFDEIYTDFCWIRNKTHVEEGELSSQVT